MGRTYLERYQIDREIGRGGMAVVYRGLDTILNRPVAVKVMHAHLLKRQDARDRFCREARVIAKLKHQNIVEVFDYSGNVPGGAAETEDAIIVTELVDGISLAEYMVMHGPMIPEIAAMVTAVVAEALDHAHQNGVIHRDVKPENIMIGARGVLKLMDFGIAHVIDMEHLTVTGAIVGSPAHMSPEQVDGKALDARTDVFSLGTLMYLLSSGQLPFSSDTPSGLLRAISEARVPDIRSRVRGFPDDLWAVLTKMMAREADRRYQSAGEVAQAIIQVLDSLGLGPVRKEMAAFFESPQVETVAMRRRICVGRVALGRAHLAAGRKALAVREADTALAVEPGNDDAAKLAAAVRKSIKAGRMLRMVLFAGACVVAALAMLWIVGRQERDLSLRYSGAVTRAVSLLRRPVDTLNPARRDLERPVARQRASVRQRPMVQALVPPPPPVDMQPAARPSRYPVTIHGYPPAVRIRVDGREAGVGRVEGLMLEPGRHQVLLSHPSCDQCRDVTTDFTVDPESPPRAPLRVSIGYRDARLLVVGPPGGKVYLNNEARPRGVTNAPIMVPMDRPTPVEFQLKVVSQGRPDHTGSLRLQAGKATALKVGD